MNFHSLAIGSALWEIMGMANYIPLLDDTVLIEGQPGRYVVAVVNMANRTTDARFTDGSDQIIRNVLWAKFSRLDESQNAARIVREATEGK